MQLPIPAAPPANTPQPLAVSPYISLNPYMDSPIYSNVPAIGDGIVDDTPGFLACIQRLVATGGGCMWLPRPRVRWRFTGKVQLFDNIWIMQDGGSGEIRQTSTETQTLFANGATNIRVEGLTLRGVGNWSSGWGDDAHLDRGCDFANCSDVKIRNTKFINYALASVWLQQCSGAEIYNCISRGPANFGAPIVQASAHNYGFVATSNDAITPAPDLSIGGCGEISGSAFGIDVGFCNRVRINDNTVRFIPGQHGMYLAASQIEVCENIVDDFALIGIKIFYAPNQTQRDVLVSSNEITTARHNANDGIQAAADVGGTLTDVEIIGNIIRNTNATPLTDGLSRGIDISSASSVVVVANKVRDVFQHGAILNSDSGTISDLIFALNKFKSPAQHGLVALGPVNNAKFSGNHWTDGTASGFGVYLSAGGDDIDFDENTIKGAFVYSINNAGVTKMRARNNTLAGYSTDAITSTVPFQLYDMSNVDGRQATVFAVSRAMQVFDRVLQMDGSGGGFTVPLPDATKMLGQIYVAVKIDGTAGAVGFAGSGGQLIDNATTKTIAVRGGVVRIVSNGTGWVSC